MQTSKKPTHSQLPKKANNRKRANRKKNNPKNKPAKMTEHTLPNSKRPQAKVTIPVINNQNLRPTVEIQAIFDDKSIPLTMACYYAYLAAKGLFNQSVNSGNDPVTNASGLGYMFQSAYVLIGGTKMELTVAPIGIWDFIAGLTGKTVPFLTYGQATYSWDSKPNVTSFSPVTMGYGTWDATAVFTDSGAYNSPAPILVTPFEEANYAPFLAKLNGLSPTTKLNIMKSGFLERSHLSKDVSAFARAFVYNGLQPSSAGGYYKDVENEVNITAPIMCSFAKYEIDTRDIRAPMKLAAYSGDAALTVGWPLHPTFTGYGNKRAPVFKMIDFEWIYVTLCQWMVFAIEKSVVLGTWEYNESVGCTQQDFRIALRQALLNVFDTQYMSQFTGPLAFQPGTENGFAPFLVSGGSYGNAGFAKLVIPTLIKENLNALKARTVSLGPYGNKGGTTYIPVLGRYSSDIPATFQVNVQADTWNLFESVPQSAINLADGSIGPGSYVNLNSSYYLGAMANWNAAVLKINQVSAKTGPIMGDSGAAGLGVLYYTSVTGVAEQAYSHPIGLPVRMVDYTKSVKNGVAKEVPKKLAKTNSQIEIIPPATMINLTQQFTTLNFPVPQEMQMLLDTLIVPEIRLDPNGTSDQLTLSMYQVEVREGMSAIYNTGTSTNGSGVFSRLSTLAQYCITGVGKDEASEYDSLMTVLVNSGKAGFLAGLLGGFAKAILPPDLHGIVDVVSDLVPI